jgi:hypothetical protein
MKLDGEVVEALLPEVVGDGFAVGVVEVLRHATPQVPCLSDIQVARLIPEDVDAR